MPRLSGQEDLRWKRALLETIGAAMRSEGGAEGDPMLLARVGRLIHNSADELEAENGRDASSDLEGIEALGVPGVRPLAAESGEAPPPFTTALLDSARIYLSDHAFDDALRFARVAALTAACEPERAAGGTPPLEEALALIAEVAYEAGRAGVELGALAGG